MSGARRTCAELGVCQALADCPHCTALPMQAQHYFAPGVIDAQPPAPRAPWRRALVQATVLVALAALAGLALGLYAGWHA